MSIYSDVGGGRRRLAALALFTAWFSVVAVLTWNHLLWRDEVRALTVALRGDSVFAMFGQLPNEGHPALWYLLLRGAHALIPRPEVLLLVFLAVASAAVLILLLRSPFSLPFLALILIGRFSIYEYSVMARNYGISMLLLFLFAMLYERRRDRDIVPGVVLFLLANCSAHSAILAAGLLLFLLVDAASGDAKGRRKRLHIFLLNAGLVAAGIIVSFSTVLPRAEDAAAILQSSHTSIKNLGEGAVLPAIQFAGICLPGLGTLKAALPILDQRLILFGLYLLVSLILLGSTLGLIRRPGAFLAALTTLVAISVFFAVVARGSYRHQALWLVFMVCLYWMASPKEIGKGPAARAWAGLWTDRLSILGTALFVLILLLQPIASVYKISGVVQNGKHDIGTILAGHPELKNAVLVAEPDYLVETMPYYVSNATYLMRERRYGNTVRYSKASHELSLSDVLSTARRLRAETGRPVVILLAASIDPTEMGQEYMAGRVRHWVFSMTPEETRAFQSATRLLDRFAPVEEGECYDAYVLSP